MGNCRSEKSGMHRTMLAVIMAIAMMAMAAARDLKVTEQAYPGNNISATVYYNNSYLQPKDRDLPMDDPRLVHKGPEFSPDQIKVGLWDPTTVLISWATGLGRVGTISNPPKPYDANSVESIVEIGTSAKSLNRTIMGQDTKAASGSNPDATRLTYSYEYDAATGMVNGEGTIYESPIMHHVLVKNLTPGMTYFYRVGSQKYGFSDVYNFTVPKDSYPFKIGVIADVGQTINSSVTLERVNNARSDIVIHIGDLSYADDWLANGTINYFNSNTVDYWSTYQPKWDSWGRLAQPMTATTIYNSIAGNHELELQWARNNVSNTAYNARYPNPQDPSRINTGANYANHWWNSSAFALYPKQGKFLAPEQVDNIVTNNTYYSINAGPAHIVFLNNYVPYDNQSVMYKWFEEDMKMVNRSKTPWVIVNFHAPWYHTYVNHYKENDWMRVYFEPAFLKYGVDLVMNGHVHAYERTPPVYQFVPNSCGPIHFTMGDGGNLEGAYKQFVDQTVSVPGVNATPPAYCGDPLLFHPASYQPTYTGEGYIDPNTPFCFASQPPWSDYRDPSFGHGVLTLLNATTAEWAWNRNIDPVGQFNDHIYIHKASPTNCTKLVVGGTAPAANANASPYPYNSNYTKAVAGK